MYRPKAIIDDVQDIAHIYGIIHSNQLIIPSRATACDTKLTINDFAVLAEWLQ